MADNQSAAHSQASSTRSTRRTVGAKLMRSPLFPALNLFTTSSIPYDVTRANFFFELLQLFGIVLHPYIGGNIAAYDVPYTTLLPLWDGRYYANNITYSGFIAIFWVLVATIVLIGLGFVVSLQSRGMVQSVILSKGMFGVAHALSTWLFLPAMLTLLAPISCAPLTGSLFMWPDQQCAFASGGNAIGSAQLVVGVIFAVVMSAMTYVLVCCVAERDASVVQRLKARPHAMADANELLFRICVAVVFHLLLPRGYNSGYLFVVVLGLAWLGLLHAVVLPYYSMTANRCKTAAYFAAAAVGLVGYIDNRTATTSFEQTGGLYLAVIAATIVFGSIGYFLAGARLSRVTHYLLFESNGTYRLPFGQLSPFERALRSGDAALLPFPSGLSNGEMIFSDWSTISVDIIDEATESGDLGEVDSVIKTPQVVSPTLDSVWMPSDVEVACRFVFDWFRHTGQPPTPHMNSFAARIFAKGAATFDLNEHVNIGLVRFISAFAPSAARMTIGLDVLDAVGGSMNPSLCALYQVYSYSDDLRKSLGLRDRSRQELLSAASRAHRDALSQTVQLWRNAPRWTNANHFASLSHQCAAVGELQSEALRLYRRGATLAPDDDQIMTAFAQFLTDVMHEEAGADLRAEAEQIAAARRSTLLMRKDSSVRSGSSTTIAGGTGNHAANIVNNLRISSRVTHRTTRNMRLLFASFAFVLLLGGGAYAATNVTFQSISSGEMSVRGVAQLRYLCGSLDLTVRQISLSASATQSTTAAVGSSSTSASITALVAQVGALGRAIQVTRNDLLVGGSKLSDPTAIRYFTEPKVVITDDNYLTEDRVSLLEILDRITAASETLKLTGATSASSISNSTSLIFLQTVTPMIIPALVSVDGVMLDWITNSVKSALVTAAVILVGMSGLGLLLLGGISYILREEAVLKAQFLSLFTRIPRHAMQQMTSLARHLYNTFAAAEQDGDDLDGDDLLDVRQTLVEQQKPVAGLTPPPTNSPKTEVEDDDDVSTVLTVDISEDEVKHSALLSLVVRRGSVNVQRVSHLVQAGATVKAEGDHHHDEHAPAEKVADFETDFNSAWKGVGAADALAEWDTFEDPPAGKTSLGKVEANSVKMPRVSGVVSFLFLLSLFFAAAGFIVSIAGAASDFSIPTLNITAGASEVETEAYRCVDSVSQLTLSGAWRFVSESQKCRDRLYGLTRRRDVQIDAATAEWHLRLRAPLFRIVNLTFIATTLSARAFGHSSTLIPDWTENATELAALAAGTLVLWDQSSLVTSDYDASVGPLPFTNSSYDLCASCGLNLTASAALAIQQRAVAVISSPHVAFDLRLIADASRAFRETQQQVARAQLDKLHLRASLLWAGGSISLIALVGLTMILISMRGEAAHLLPTGLTATAVVIVAIISVALSFSTATADEVFVGRYRTTFAIADAVSTSTTSINEAIAAATKYVAVGRNNDLEYFSRVVDSDSSLDVVLQRTAALQLSTDDFGALSALNAQRRDVVTHLRAALAIASARYGPWYPVQGMVGANFNRTAEPGFPADDLDFIRDHDDQSTAEDLRNDIMTFGMVYSTKPVSQNISDALRTLSSDAVRSSVASLERFTESVADSLLRSTWSMSNSTASKNTRSLNAVIAAGAVGLCAILCVIGAVILSSISDIENGTDGAERLFEREFRPMQTRSASTLFVIVVGFLVIFGVTFNFLQTRLDAIDTVALIFERTAAVQQAASSAATLLSETTSSSPSSMRIRALQQSIAQHLNETRNLRAEGYFNSAGVAVRSSTSGLDSLLFGPTSPRAAVYPSSSSCYESFSANQQDLDSILFYVELNERAIIAIDPSAAINSPVLLQRMKQYATNVQSSYSAVISALRTVDTQYNSAVSDQRTLSTAVLAALYAFVVLTVGFTLVVVLWPVEHKVEEQSATIALLLSSLPDDVKSNVPELSEYFNAGTFGDDEKKNLAQSEQLLQNILPPVISRRLKSGESPIADDHRNVTVVFAALCNFDKYSLKMEAREMVVAMNRIIVTFDDIVDQLDLEKIKTIGDIYFLCGGLTSKTGADHQLRSVECALNFMEALEEFAQRTSMPDLKLKVGVHTGAAVAGVIGSSKVAYDLWGDTVNTSSRMMSTGKEGRMQLMASTYLAVKDYFSFDEGAVVAKGKGQLKTYIWSGRKGLPSPYHGKVNWRKSLQ